MNWIRIALLLFLSLSPIQAYLASSYSSVTTGDSTLTHDYYLYCNVTVYNGQSVYVQLKASAPVTLMVMNQHQFEEFSQGDKYSSLYREVTQSLDSDFEVLGGEYYVVVYNNVVSVTVSVHLSAHALPIEPLVYHSSLPAPIGLGFYGIVNESGRITGFVTPYQEAIGYATVYSILAYNATPPKGVNPWGSSLQMNAVLQVNTTRGTYVYWLQNVVEFVTDKDAYCIEDNVWNYSSGKSTLTNTSVTGEGYVYFLESRDEYYYASPDIPANYSLPFSVVLYTKLVSITPESINVSFGYNLGSGVVWYDNVTIHQTDTISALLLVNPFNATPSGDPYDLDLVFVGEGNYEYTYFEQMNASLGLQMVLLNGKVVTPSPLYTFGMTGEEADNLRVIDVDGRAFVIPGNNTFWNQVNVKELPELYFRQGGNNPSVSNILSTYGYTLGYLVFFLVVFLIVLSALRRLIRRRRRRKFTTRRFDYRRRGRRFDNRRRNI
ncbi:Thermopsin [Sulfuracidifex tepidarius]|uniref:Thermopsin n=1 Tax=Sulfuracidifex tepidarius TaxID=1294262 RepID=A0A510DT50_9CREN|nr:thermopsin [Sulfuracidifex tepidarius]BBG23334.1 Thermopsin [Sulfuracidifex tepidarius]